MNKPLIKTMQLMIHDPSMASIYNSHNDDCFAIPLKASLRDNGSNILKIDRNEAVSIPTGISLYMVQTHYVGRILPRHQPYEAGLTIGHMLKTAYIKPNDNDEIHLSIFNNGNKPIVITKHQHIADLLVTPVITPEFEIVDTFKRRRDSDS